MRCGRNIHPTFEGNEVTIKQQSNAGYLSVATQNPDLGSLDKGTVKNYMKKHEDIGTIAERLLNSC